MSLFIFLLFQIQRFLSVDMWEGLLVSLRYKCLMSSDSCIFGIDRQLVDPHRTHRKLVYVDLLDPSKFSTDFRQFVSSVLRTKDRCHLGRQGL